MNRYQRQIIVDKLGTIGQEKLQNAHVAIIGMGGLGCPASVYLTGAGVGKLTLIDHDTVSLSNLHRQTLYRESDVGQPKSTVAKHTLSDLNREVAIHAIADKITADTADAVLADANIIVDAADNFAISYLLSDYACEQAKPLVSASVMQTSGYVGVYGFSTATNAPCPSLRAVFPNPPAVGQDCNSVGVIGTTAGLTGILQAQEILKVIVGDPNQLAGRLLSIDCWTHRQHIIDFNGAPEPEHYAIIIAESDITDRDWVVDVRNDAEVRAQPKRSHQHMPLSVLNIADLPTNKRIVFTCASGQRALSAADVALASNIADVAVVL